MKINELEDLLGVSRSTIRYYEEQGLVDPPRLENGYRDYSDEDVQKLQKIIVLRKLGVGISEIKDLIEGKADLHDVLDQNVESLRSQQSEISSMIDMCEKLGDEAQDFAGIDSPKYLKQIYEDEQKGAQFAKTKEISARQLNLAITLLGALAGVPTPQNKLFSERSNEPLPADIRGNKKEGDEYDTIGDVLKKGGKRKAVVIALAAILIVMGIFNGLAVWGGLGFSIKYIFDFNKSGISTIEPDAEEMEMIGEADPDFIGAEDEYYYSGLFKFHTKDGSILLSLRRSEGGKWTQVENKEIKAKEGYLFITGGPSSEIVMHVIVDGKSIKDIISVNDSSYGEDDTHIQIDYNNQMTLSEEHAIMLFLKGGTEWDDIASSWDDDLFDEVLEKTPPADCYAIVVREAE